jgi:AraC-like DNA-binding protein
MITFVTLDLMARGGTVALLLLWSWLLWRDHRHTLAARVAIGMNATIICYVVSSLMWKERPFTLPAMLVDSGSVMAPAMFWLFAHVWFSDSTQVGRARWAAVGAFALIPALQIASILLTGAFAFPLWVAVRVGMAAFAAMGLWIAWRGRDNDLVESRRRFRTTLVWLIGCFAIWVNFMEMMPLPSAQGQALRNLTEIAILASTFVVSAALYGFANPELFAPAERPDAAAKPPQAPSPLAERLRTHMTHERPYRAEGLTIAALAAQLGEQEYRLRRLINGELGFRNFTAFLNSYRLAEVREALSDPEQRPVSILTIALDAGFGSLGPFNRAFRETEGMTPTAFRAKA